jgi:NMD protein affecting ribosome stability and mRNA decay
MIENTQQHMKQRCDICGHAAKRLLCPTCREAVQRMFDALVRIRREEALDAERFRIQALQAIKAKETEANQAKA